MFFYIFLLVFLIFYIAFSGIIIGVVGGKYIFYENEAYDDDEKESNELYTYLKKKENDIQMKTEILIKRNILDKPSKFELDILEKECNHVVDICTHIDCISCEIGLCNNPINTIPLRNITEKLRQCIKKWENVLRKDDAIDEILDINVLRHDTKCSDDEMDITDIETYGENDENHREELIQSIRHSLKQKLQNVNC